MSEFDQDPDHNAADILGDTTQQQETPGHHGAMVPTNEYLPERIYLLPIHNRPFFPAQVQPLVIQRQRWQETIQRVANTNHQAVGVAYVGDAGSGELEPTDFPEIGTAVKVHKIQGEDQQIQFIAQGMRRFRIVRWLSKKPPYLVEVSYPKEPIDAEDEEARAYAMAMINGIKELVPINPLYGEELKQYLNRFSPNEPSPLTDFAAAITTGQGRGIAGDSRDPAGAAADGEGAAAAAEGDRGRPAAERDQRGGQRADAGAPARVLPARADQGDPEGTGHLQGRPQNRRRYLSRTAGASRVPEPVMSRIDEELKKLSVLETGSPEYGTTRNYLDWLTAVPWGVTSDDQLDLEARPPDARS